MRKTEKTSLSIDQYSLLPAAFERARNHDRVSARWFWAISCSVGILVASLAAAYQRNQVSLRADRYLANAAGPAFFAKRATLAKMQQADQFENALSSVNRFRPTDKMIQTIGAIGAAYQSDVEVGCVNVNIDQEQGTFSVHLLAPPSRATRLEQALATVDRIESVSRSELLPQDAGTSPADQGNALMIFEGTLVRRGVSSQ